MHFFKPASNFFRSPSLLFLCTITIIAFNTHSANAQSCPLSVGPFRLQHTSPDTNQFGCRNDVNTAGNTNCTLGCTYQRPDRREVNSFSIYFEYTAKVQSVVSVGSRYMCTRSSDINLINDSHFQVLAQREYVSDAEERIQSDHIITRMFKALELVAVSCPGRQPQPAPAPVSTMQICPNRIGDFFLFNPFANLGYPMNMDPKCERDDNGNTVCRTSCNYRDSNAPGANSFLLSPVWTKVFGGPRLPDRAMCVLAARAPWLAHTTRQAVVRFVGVDETLEQDSANQLSKQILSNVASDAVACPNPSVGLSNCESRVVQLRELWAKREVVKNEIKELQNAETKLTESRAALNKANEIIRGLNVPNYSGPEREAVQRLKTDESLRRQLAFVFLLPLNTDPLTIMRAAAKMEESEVEYYSAASGRLSKLLADVVAIDIEGKALRASLANQECFQGSGTQSCDLDGKWTFFVSVPGGENEHFVWDFSPYSGDIYTAKNQALGIDGTIEIFGRRAILAFRNTDISGFYDLTFNRACNEAKGVLKYTGQRANVDVRAIKVQ